MRKDISSPIGKDDKFRVATWIAENTCDLGVLYNKVLDDLDREVFHLGTIPLSEIDALECFINEVKTKITEFRSGKYVFVTDRYGREINRGYESWEKVVDEDDDY